jgi:hypothetical protein
MSWTSPRTWVASELVTASICNTHIRDQFDYLKATPSLSTLTLTGGAGAASLTVPATGRVYLDGGTNTYLSERAADTVTLVAGGTAALDVNATECYVYGELVMSAAKKLYLDGGSNTYLQEHSADTIRIAAGGAVNLTVTSTNVEVGGGLKMTTWPTVAGSANVIAADGVVLKIATSVRAAKKDIETISDAVARAVVLGLRPVTFRSAVDDDPRIWPGFIAEEVEAVTPDLVTYTPSGVLQSVAYDRVAAYLVPVVQAQERRIAALTLRMTKLEARFA